MKVTVEQLDHLFKKYRNTIEMRYLVNLTINNQNFFADDLILPSHIRDLINNDIKTIDIYYTQAIYNYFSTEFPVEYRKPYNQMRYVDFDKYLEELNYINLQSSRKRYLRLVGDLYGVDKGGRRKILAGHNELIGYDRWNYVKRYVDKSQKIYYRNSETSIIIFVDMADINQTEYIDKFKKNTDLISVMVSYKSEKLDKIAPDFVPTEDVISVTDPEELLNEYKKCEARLIIIGENLNDSSKNALLSVKRYDKYVRMMIVPQLDHRNLDHFFEQVRLVYNTNRWE